MSDLVSATPVRSNLAQMLLQLKDLPADVVSDGLSRLVALEKTPQYLKASPIAAPVMERHTSSDEEQNINRDNSAVEDTCNCRKSRCLKLYCQCFAAKIFCSPTCNCESCANSLAHTDLRLDAIKSILERNPAAFDSKFKTASVSASAITHKTGCRCRKSMCLKKYCECYQAAVPCSPICTCLHCCNTPDDNVHGRKDDAKAHARKTVGEEVEGEDSVLFKAAFDLAQMKHEHSHSGSSDDGSNRGSRCVSPSIDGGSQSGDTQNSNKRVRKQLNLASSPLTPSYSIQNRTGVSSNSPGPSMLSILPPPRSMVIKPPPLSLPNGKRKRDAVGSIDDSSPNSTGSNPSPNRVKPSILNRPKSCPSATSNKFDGLDDSIFQNKFGTPNNKDSSRFQNYSINMGRQLSVRSASPNTLHVATALSLLCGLGSKSPDSQSAAITGNTAAPRHSPSLSPTGSPVPAETSQRVEKRIHSGSIDRIDVTSEEDFCDVSPHIPADSIAANQKLQTVKTPTLLVESLPMEVTNFDQLSTLDGDKKTSSSVIRDWSSPAVNFPEKNWSESGSVIANWSKPAVLVGAGPDRTSTPSPISATHRLVYNSVETHFENRSSTPV